MDTNFPRLLETLRLVPAYGQPAASTSEIHRRLIARGISTSARTVQRDLDALASHYGIERDDRTKPYGWRWPRNAKRLSLPEMDWPEALSFRLLEDYLAGLLPDSVSEHLRPYFEQARRKLDSQFRTAPIKRWPEKVRVVAPNQPLVAPTVKRAVHSAVSEALLEECQLEVAYRSVGSPDAQTYRIHPLGLVLEGNVLYLVARFFDYDDARTLAMHRIERATRLSETASAPDDFTLDGYVEAGGFGCGSYGTILLDATWKNYCGDHLLQAKLAQDQISKILEDGVIRIRARVQYTQRLYWWLLGFGANVVVHAPKGLRKELASAHKAAASQYVEK